MNKRIDWTLAIFAVAIVICFVGLSTIVYGWITETALFQIGFSIVISGLILMILLCLILVVVVILRKV